MINSPILAEQKPFIPSLSFIKAETIFTVCQMFMKSVVTLNGGIMKKIINLLSIPIKYRYLKIDHQDACLFFL